MAKKAATKGKKAEAKPKERPAREPGGTSTFEGHVTASDLATALGRIRQITTRTKLATLPVVACVHLNLHGDTLLATGTDLEATLQLPMSAAVDAPGIVTVNANRLYAIAKGLGDEALRLRTVQKKGEADTMLEVKGKTVKYHLLTVPPEEYPPVPPAVKGTAVQIDRESLTSALKRVRCAIGEDESRPFLMGVFAEAKGEAMTLTATDGHRLSQQTVELVDKVKATTWLIPEPAIELMIDLTKKDDDGKDGPVTIAGDDKTVEITVGKAHLWTKQIEGAFPKYMEIVEKRQKSATIKLKGVPVEEFQAALELAGLVAARGSAVAQLTFAEDGASVFCRDEIGTAEATFPMKWPGKEPLSIAFKAAYLRDYLDDAPKEGVELWTGMDPLDPILFTEARGLYVVMPMRVEKPQPKPEKPVLPVSEIEVEPEPEEEAEEPAEPGD